MFIILSFVYLITAVIFGIVFLYLTSNKPFIFTLIHKFRLDKNKGETEYLFDSISDIQSEYKAVDDTLADTNKLLDAYRLNLYYEAPVGNLTLMDVYDKAYYDGGDDINAKGVTEDLKGLPCIVYDAQNGTAGQVINAFVQMLTNAGGTLDNTKSNISAFTSVTAKRAVVKDGNMIIDSSDKPSLTVNGVNVSYNHYDTYDVNKGTSLTLLELSYGFDNGLSGDQKITARETIYLPVYVLERLDVNTYIRMAEGAIYSFENMKNSTIGDGSDKDNVIMANDTTYTLGIEFLYGSGRTKFATETVNKVLKLETSTVTDTGTIVQSKGLAAGTRLTLIDVETGYAYY